MGAKTSKPATQRFQVADYRPKKQLRRTPFEPQVAPLVEYKPRIIDIQNKNQWRTHFNAFKYTNKLLVMSFTAKWCGPCKILVSKLEEFSAKYTDVEFLNIDVDVLMGLSKQFKVHTLPTMVFMKAGQELDRIVGVNVDELQKNIDQYKQPF